MKRASLISVLLTMALAIACTTPTNNANKNGSGSISPPGTTSSGLVTIAIAITQDPAQTLPTVEVTDPIYAGTKPQKIRWCVYNNTGQQLTQLSIEFTSGSPCANVPPPNLTLTNIPAGNDPAMCTETCECIATPGGFPYLVNVTTASGGHPTSPNPRVILN